MSVWLPLFDNFVVLFGYFSCFLSVKHVVFGLLVRQNKDIFGNFEVYGSKVYVNSIWLQYNGRLLTRYHIKNDMKYAVDMEPHFRSPKWAWSPDLSSPIIIGPYTNTLLRHIVCPCRNTTTFDLMFVP